MKRLVLAIALIVSVGLGAQDKVPTMTIDSALTTLDTMVRQRTSVQTRTASQKQGVRAVSRDWEIDAQHLVNKARAVTKMKPGTQKDILMEQVIDHALRLVAEDSRQGNEDRETETYTAVRNVLVALTLGK